MAGQPTPEETTMGAVEALLSEAFGLRLLSYLCATDQATMHDRLHGRGSLPPASESVLIRALGPLSRRVAERPELPKSLALEFLVHRSEPGALPLGSSLRQMAGGSIDVAVVESFRDDHVMTLLARMIVDSYPLYLAPVDEHRPFPVVSMFRHPLREELQAAVHEDNVLGSMYTAEDDSLGRRGYVLNSLGRGQTIQDVMFAEMVIGSAWDTASMAIPEPSVSDVVEAAGRNVGRLRMGLRGEETSVPAKIFFTGFTIGSREIRTPWGLLRPIRDWERSLAPPMLGGAVSGTDEHGQHVTTSYAGEVVLETEVAYALRVESDSHVLGNTTAQPQWPSSPVEQRLSRRIEGLPLAALLGSDRPVGSWVTARLAWTWTGDPFSHGGNVGWQDAASAPGFMPTELTEAECLELEDWAVRVDSHWIPQIDIAFRRMLSAAHARTDASDRLVDAVIVWENLFGTRQGESGLRISSAMAWLLADSTEARQRLRSEIHHIYNDRSAVVHGRQLEETLLNNQANSAIVHSRDALRVLLRDRPDVLALTENGARSVHLLMGN